MLSYFSVVVCLIWLYCHILSSFIYISREYWDLVSIICVQSIDVQSMVFANDRILYGLSGRVRLFEDHTISLSSLCRLIWRHWTNKMLVRYRLPSVCLRLRLFSQLSFIQYMGIYVSSAYSIRLSWLWECVLLLLQAMHSSDTEAGPHHWTADATECLVALYIEHEVDVEDPCKEKDVWTEIAKELSKIMKVNFSRYRGRVQR